MHIVKLDKNKLLTMNKQNIKSNNMPRKRDDIAMRQYSRLMAKLSR